MPRLIELLVLLPLVVSAIVLCWPSLREIPRNIVTAVLLILVFFSGDWK